VDDCNASVRWAFYFEVKVFGLRSWTQIRKARLVAVGTLAMLAWVTAASAGQTSTGDSTAKKPAATTTSSHKTHTSTAKSSPTGATKSASTHTTSGKHSSHKKSAKVRGQQKIDSERAQAIQEALIREHYMTGEATGTWNEASEEAMRRYQADHGWQSKTVPDSRALIKLGLGPSKDHLLNPESAMTTVPDAPRAEPLPTTSHSTPPAADPAPPASQNDSRPQ
jgi:hypothetical protein